MTQQTPPAYVPPQPLSQSDERLWATLIHVGGIIISFISPLIGYLVLKDRSTFVKEHSRTGAELPDHDGGGAGRQLHRRPDPVGRHARPLGLVQILISLAIWIIVVIFSIIAAIAANKGEMYKYPLTIQFVK